MGRLRNQTALVTGGRSGIGSSKLEIRDAREAELPAMVNVTKASYAEFQTASPSGFWDVYMTNVEEAIMRASDTERIAAFFDGELVASVLLCHRSFVGDDPEIRLLAVLPAFRRHGIARQLMDECERRVRRMGKPRVVLHTTHLMSTARAWYERAGYSRFEAIDFSPVPGFLVMGFAKDLKAKKASESQ
jgi:ribosomal protein S18 acetylase RimI-like enzyme